MRGDNWVNQCAWRAQGRTPGQLPLIAMATAYLPRPGPSSLPSHTTSLTLSVASYTVGVFKKRDRTFFVLLEITQGRVGKIVQSNDSLIFLQPINIFIKFICFYVIFFHCFDFIFIIKSMFFQDLHDENEDD